MKDFHLNFTSICGLVERGGWTHVQVLSGEQQGLFYFGKTRKQNKDLESEKDVVKDEDYCYTGPEQTTSHRRCVSRKPP